MAKMPDLGKMYGPLPLGAWIAVVFGGLAIMFYTRSQSGGEVEYGDEYVPVDTSPTPGVGTGPGWVAVPPPDYAPEEGEPESRVPTTNEEWGRAAVNWLIAQGYDPAMADSAVRKYLAGESLGAQEYSLISIVLGVIGSTPVTMPPPMFGPPTIKPPTVGAPSPVAPKPGPKPKPRPGAKKPRPKPKPRDRDRERDRTPKPKRPNRPGNRPGTGAKNTRNVQTRVVRPGDSLSKIARQTPGVSWQAIYNANKGKISNPNLIFPGQKLVIPRGNSKPPAKKTAPARVAPKRRARR